MTTQNEEKTRKRALGDLLAYEDTITTEVERTVQKIRERVKVLHHELDRYVTDVLHQLKQKFESELRRVRYAIDKLKGTGGAAGGGARAVAGRRRGSSLDKTPRYRSTPRSTEPSSVIYFSLNSSVGYNDVDNLDQFDKKVLTFVEGETSDHTFQKLVGHYTFDNSSVPISFTSVQRALNVNRKSEVKLLKTFKCGDASETVHAIAPVGDSQAWVCCGWGSRTMHLYDRHGHKVKSATLDIQVNDATTFNDGNSDVVLVSSYREKSIKRLNQDTLKASDFAYISLFPGGLCRDTGTGIYVSFRDNYQREATFGSRRMVAKLSKHGEIVATFEKDDEDRNIFGYPFRLAVNVNGDICVSDYGDGTRGVKILHKDGTVKCWYKGPPSGMGSDQPFLPHGIVCDEAGHVLVSDWNNDSVHVLDSEGNFLLQLVTEHDGIEGPNSLALDKRGHLWVGDSHGVVRIFKYNIVED